MTDADYLALRELIAGSFDTYRDRVSMYMTLNRLHNRLSYVHTGFEAGAL